MDPLFWVFQKAKIWSPCMVEPVLITNNINKKYATEYTCMTVGTSNNLKFINNLKLLKDKNVMIDNSGASCDSTPHEDGIKMSLNGKAGDSITNASGDNMAKKYVGDMHVRKFNIKGKVINKLIIENVIIIPDVK